MSQRTADDDRPPVVSRMLEIDDCLEYRDRQHQHQPFEVIASQHSGEMENQNNDGDDVIEREQNIETP